MDGHVKALRLSINIARFAILERYMELKGDKKPIYYDKICEKFNTENKQLTTDYLFDKGNLKAVSDKHWDTYLNAPDEYILNLKN